MEDNIQELTKRVDELEKLLKITIDEYAGYISILQLKLGITSQGTDGKVIANGIYQLHNK
ncbi:MAG: hypothetical protein BGO31_19375 [Bacteroidetes bacterium 43-16]|nr:MAG: hypothetical protein BGO31_19375 [Bacteroidetes bacterium 43-16]